MQRIRRILMMWVELLDVARDGLVISIKNMTTEVPGCLLTGLQVKERLKTMGTNGFAIFNTCYTAISVNGCNQVLNDLKIQIPEIACNNPRDIKTRKDQTNEYHKPTEISRNN